MGMISLFRSCSTNYQPSSVPTPAPNPDPSRWKVLDVWQYKYAYVLKVHYLDCTNFEGVKVMVYRGAWPAAAPPALLDPHFTDSPDSPIARFRPDKAGVEMARALARTLVKP